MENELEEEIERLESVIDDLNEELSNTQAELEDAEDTINNLREAFSEIYAIAEKLM